MRNKIIDILRGISIFMVVFGHVTKIECIQTYIWSFHIPVFFLISGYLYNPLKYKTYKQFLSKKLKSLIIPYFVFGIITFLFWLLTEYTIRPTGMNPCLQLFGLLWGTRLPPLLNFNGPLWFIPCLFSTSIIFYFAEKVKKPFFIFLLTIILFTLGTISNKICPGLPFGICAACIGLVFYATGVSINKYKQFLFYIKSWISKHKTISYVIILILLAFQLILAPYSKANLAFRETGNPLIYIGLAILGFIIYWLISVEIGESEVLEYIGKNSLVIFTIHGPVYKTVIYIMSVLTRTDIITIRDNVLWCFAITAITLISIIPIIILWNKWKKTLIK